MAAPALSARQAEVIRLAAAGLTMDGTARRLGISVNTVKRYRRDAFWKLGARNRTEAAVALYRLDREE